MSDLLTDRGVKVFKRKFSLFIFYFLLSCLIVNAAQENIVEDIFGNNVYHLVKENYPSLFFSGSYLDSFVNHLI